MKLINIGFQRLKISLCYTGLIRNMLLALGNSDTFHCFESDGINTKNISNTCLLIINI